MTTDNRLQQPRSDSLLSPPVLFSSSPLPLSPIPPKRRTSHTQCSLTCLQTLQLMEQLPQFEFAKSRAKTAPLNDDVAELGLNVDSGDDDVPLLSGNDDGDDVALLSPVFFDDDETPSWCVRAQSQNQRI
jgi:hypothetical protein